MFFGEFKGWLGFARMLTYLAPTLKLTLHATKVFDSWDDCPISLATRCLVTIPRH